MGRQKVKIVMKNSKKEEKIKMAKQRAIRLNLNRTFKEKNFSCDRNIIKDGKNEIAFEPACVFTEEKKRFQFLRGRKNLVLFVDGAFTALKFSETTDQMNPFWTQEEEKKLIKREMKKSLAEHKPMTWAQFIVLLIPILIMLGVLIKIAFHFKVF